MKNKPVLFVGMGFELLGIVFACVYVGTLLDKIWNTNGLMMAGTTILGMAGWFYHLIVMLKK